MAYLLVGGLTSSPPPVRCPHVGRLPAGRRRWVCRDIWFSKHIFAWASLVVRLRTGHRQISEVLALPSLHSGEALVREMSIRRACVFSRMPALEKLPISVRRGMRPGQTGVCVRYPVGYRRFLFGYRWGGCRPHCADVHARGDSPEVGLRPTRINSPST